MCNKNHCLVCVEEWYRPKGPQSRSSDVQIQSIRGLVGVGEGGGIGELCDTNLHLALKKDFCSYHHTKSSSLCLNDEMTGLEE